MIAVIDAQLAWCPPTFSPSLFSRMWLAWWMVQAESHRSRSSRVFKASMSVVSGFSIARALDHQAVTRKAPRLPGGGSRSIYPPRRLSILFPRTSLKPCNASFDYCDGQFRLPPSDRVALGSGAKRRKVSERRLTELCEQGSPFRWAQELPGDRA